MKRLLLYIIMCGYAALALASNADSALVEHHSLWRTIDSEARQNPALHGVAYRLSLSELSLGINLSRQSEAFVLENGKGYSLPYLGVESFLKLSERTSVWGTASYKTGSRREIKWNSTSDYDLLQPYVLADTLGGDTRCEQYLFSGGYATRLQQWLLGAEMLVRAEQEYRDQDPRMRGVVTELRLRIGAGREIRGYRLGAAFEGNIYKQTNSVEFYNEEGVIPEYQMTGLGTEYSRFSGDKRSIYYDGGGVALLMNAYPVDGRGLYADLTLDEHRYHRKLADYNSMPLTDLYQEHAGLTIGWKNSGKSRLALYGKARYTRRTGDEHVGGTSNARYFPVIACLTMYKGHIVEMSAGGIYGRKSWNVLAEGGYRNQTEKYVYPERQMDYSQLYGRLTGQWFLKASSVLLLTLEGHAAYTAHLDDQVVMPYANMDAKTIQLISHKRDYAKANYTELGGGVRADYSLPGGRYALFARLAAGTVLCSVNSHQTDLHASLGITF